MRLRSLEPVSPDPTAQCRADRRPARAFTLLEVLVVMLVIGILAAISVVYLQNQIPHLRLRQSATELSGFLQKARLAAIRSGHNVRIEPVITLDPPTERLIMEEQQVDGSWKQIAYWDTPKTSSGSAGVYLLAHTGTVGDDEAVTFEDQELVFTTKGSNLQTGAFRLTCLGNTLEVALDSLAGIPVVRKYLKPADRPPSAVDILYFREGGAGSALKWKWY
jgi:prepilin-type N-terminal cleavage/methylation domain-containing protein